MAAMPRRGRVVTWNGKDVPPEFRDLPAGRYVVEAVDEEAPTLSPERRGRHRGGARVVPSGSRRRREARPRNHRRSPRALKVTYTEESIANIVEATTFINERNPAAAAKLHEEITRCIERLAAREFAGPVSRFRSGAVVRS